MLDIDVPEVRGHGEPPLDYVSRVAREKAGAGLLHVVAVPDAWVLGADTEVILDDEVFGKPADAAAAARMLHRLSGRTHTVATAVWLVSAGQEHQTMSVSEVTFDALDDARVERYIASGEWQGKAGAYGIQGDAQAFIRHLSGSHSGVMGLPLFETGRLLRQAGVIA